MPVYTFTFISLSYITNTPFRQQQTGCRVITICTRQKTLFDNKVTRVSKNIQKVSLVTWIKWIRGAGIVARGTHAGSSNFRQFQRDKCWDFNILQYIRRIFLLWEHLCMAILSVSHNYNSMFIRMPSTQVSPPLTLAAFNKDCNTSA